MSAAQVGMWHTPVEALRWDGTMHGVIRVLDFLAEKGQTIAPSIDRPYEYQAGYVPRSEGVAGHDVIHFMSACSPSSLSPGEWLIWDGWDFFSANDETVGRRLDLDGDGQHNTIQENTCLTDARQHSACT